MRGETVAETLRAPGRAFLALLAPLFLLAVLAPSLARGDGFENGQGMEFVAVPAGSFWMGALDGDKEAMDWETPRHRVTISRPFYVGKYKVTRAQWNALAPPKGPGDNYPANFLTFGEIKTFIAKLNQLEKTSAYRLPTEAEWEYFARAGGESLYFYGDDPALMRDYADCPNDDITPVGLYPPNGWGIHDVLHTLSELTGDWYGRDYYAVSPEVDPQGPALGEGRSVRGTCYWGMDESRVSDRGWVTLEEPFEFTSFRLVADADVPLEKRPGETQRLRLRRGAK